MLIKVQLDATVCRHLFTATSRDVAVNKCLHTVASSWTFINIPPKCWQVFTHYMVSHPRRWHSSLSWPWEPKI